MVLVSLGGLVINISGLFILGEVDGTDGHNNNMKGLFLHVLADTLGSLGVLLSCFLIKKYDWVVSDPLCAMLVSVMIFVSVLPLLKSSCISLLGSAPTELEGKE